MAITFDDAMRHPAPRQGHYLAVSFTLVLTQEDGRTAFAQGSFGVDQGQRTLSAGINNADGAFDVLIYFSDRNHFAGQPDRMGIEVGERHG
jgi:hypothetical protein